MNAHRFDDVGKFHDSIEPMLIQHEAENNFMLGLTAGLRKEPPHPEHIYLAAMDGDSLAAAAVRTPPWPLDVTRGTDAAMDAIANWAYTHEPTLNEISGSLNSAKRCAATFAKLAGKHVKVRDLMRIMQLSHVIPPTPSAGAMRVAGQDDQDLIFQWMDAFGIEVNELHAIPRERLIKRLNLNQLHLWEDGKPVAVAGWTGRTPNGLRINAVYTPPEFRGRGYASNLVAALTQKMLDEGRKFCFLYTDASNPISNKIYERIGYSFVCDWANVQIV
jgi:hypothetical protein